MKPKLVTILRKIHSNKYSLLIVIIMLACSEGQAPSSRKPDFELLKSDVLAKSFVKYKVKGGSMNDVANFLKTQYNINYDEQYEKLLPYFAVTKSLSKNARGQDITMSDFSLILENVGIVPGSQSHSYFVEVSNLFEGGILTEGEIFSQLSVMKNQIENNYSMDPVEKEKILMTSTLLLSNFNGIADYILMNEGGIIGRTKGFAQVWRVFRSVILTAGVGILIGWYAGGPIGAIVGGTLMGIVAVVDAGANGYCHFAMQCDGGWRQDCASGVCMPY